MMPRVGFAGMTHLGLVSASAVCSKGFQTVCFDEDVCLVEKLCRGDYPVSEPGLNELIAANGAQQIFSAAIDELGACDVVYIAPDVPTDSDGRSDLAGIRALIDRVFTALSESAILVILCQVPPGFTRGLSNLPEARIFYQVETLVFGNAIERANFPERFIVGCADPGFPLPDSLRDILEAFKCPVLPMQYESAELAKISINMCLVSMISVANTMAEICEAIGADWSEIVPALKLDKRIGPHSYLRPGLGIAGGNLERDIATVLAFAAEHETDAGTVTAWLANSWHRKNWAADILNSSLLDQNPRATVAIWGLAYKENTNSVKNSPSLLTIEQLGGARLRVHDPVVPASSLRHPNAVEATDPIDALEGADALAILTPWPDYREISMADIAAALSGTIILDPYGVLDRREVAASGFDYYTLGAPPRLMMPVDANGAD